MTRIMGYLELDLQLSGSGFGSKFWRSFGLCFLGLCVGLGVLWYGIWEAGDYGSRSQVSEDLGHMQGTHLPQSLMPHCSPEHKVGLKDWTFLL